MIFGKTTGFASPAQGYEEQIIDLNRLLIQNPPATFFFRLETSEMTALGLPYGSILIVDRSLAPKPDTLVLIQHEDQFIARLLTETNGKPSFTNSKEIIYPTPNETQIIGVITASIKTYDNAH